MDADKLAYMANQMAKFFAHQGPERGAEAVAQHIRRYWDPRMRTAILAHLASGGEGLDPISLAAVQQLQQPATAKG